MRLCQIIVKTAHYAPVPDHRENRPLCAYHREKRPLCACARSREKCRLCACAYSEVRCDTGSVKLFLKHDTYEDPEPPADPQIEALVRQLEQENEDATLSFETRPRCPAGFAKRNVIVTNFFSN
ncbi:hypothetical protein TNCV_932131 [Trichonephila clavipes]|nr:hypothetical protein TNCV_932131 [Trichonephila clavipes]